VHSRESFLEQISQSINSVSRNTEIYTVWTLDKTPGKDKRRLTDVPKDNVSETTNDIKHKNLVKENMLKSVLDYKSWQAPLEAGIFRSLFHVLYNTIIRYINISNISTWFFSNLIPIFPLVCGVEATRTLASIIV